MIRIQRDLDANAPLFSVLWDDYLKVEDALSDDQATTVEDALHDLDAAWNEGRTLYAAELHQALAKAIRWLVS